MISESISNSEQETILAGERFASRLKLGDIVLLKGDLGAGKTHFIKGVARYFGIAPEDVQSPTFSIVHEYSGRITLYHLDCYRLKSVEESYEIGLDHYLYGDGICVIEWPENVSSMLPDEALTVKIEHIDAHKRKIMIHQHK